MRQFHNWIKSIILYTYCEPTKYKRDGKIKKNDILDIGCGRGGDLLKFYHVRAGYVVGIDPDYEGIYSATDSALTRYKENRRKFPDFPRMDFLQADGGVPFVGKLQEAKLGNMRKDNKDGIDKIFTKDRKFDIINSQFAIHYLFDSDNSLNNLVDNINNYLKTGGYLIFTLFDKDLVNKAFDDKGAITGFYTDDEGNRTKLYEIVKKFDDNSKGTGIGIDVYMSWISQEGKYIREFLVDKNFMIDTMTKRCNCRLVETELFENIYNMNRDYFKDVIQYEENKKNREFYQKVAKFYGDLKGADKESRNYSFLFRYYIFQKI
jgi:SAM-dependent methyltransferase